MRIKFMNQFVYISLIFAMLMCFGCLETDQIADVITAEPPVDTTPEPDPLPPGTGLAIGATAPAFSLPDADGNIVSLSDYAGKVIVVQFYSTGT